MKDAANTPTRSGKSEDGNSIAKSKSEPNKTSSAVITTTNNNTKKQNKTEKKVKGKKQAKIPDHPKTDYSRECQFRYDARIKLDELLDEASLQELINSMGID